MRKKHKKVTLTKRIADLEVEIHGLYNELYRMRCFLSPIEEFSNLVKQLESTSRATQNALGGVEVAVARLIPKESIQFLPQFQISPVLVKRENELKGYLL